MIVKLSDIKITSMSTIKGKISMAVKKTGEVEVLPRNQKSIEIFIIGMTPLITHAWSEKAKKMMRDKQMGKAVPKKSPKDPEEDFKSAMYLTTDGVCGYPASGLKAAIVTAARITGGVPMTKLKVAIFVEADDPFTGLLKIYGKHEPIMREDMVRLETGVADMRYRPEFREWAMKLRVTFNANILTEEQVVNLIDSAGDGGIGEWRASAPNSYSGDFGRFRIRTNENVTVFKPVVPKV